MERALAEFLTHAPVFLRLPDGKIVYWSVGCEEVYGYSGEEAIGRCSHELLRTVFVEGRAAAEAALASTGEWRGRLRHRAKDGRVIWSESLWRLRKAQEPAATLVIEQNTDITDRIEVERHRELLARELDHRVKNTLAIVQGIARLTFGRADKALLEAFDERLAALSEAHNLLARERWSHADLKEIISEVMRPLQLADRIQMDGEPVRLTPTAAVAYALAFHELATNAVKHGALGAPGGRVEITWSLTGAEPRRIHLTWREHGGPRVAVPSREGFGTRLIRRAVAAELSTPVELRYDPEGLVCEFDGPVQMTPPGALSTKDVLVSAAMDRAPAR
jgi:PAS domain S-box-containing protein